MIGAVGQATTYHEANEDPTAREPPEEGGAVEVEGVGVGLGAGLAGLGVGDEAAAMRIRPDCAREAFESWTLASNHFPQVAGARTAWTRFFEKPETPARPIASPYVRAS